MSTDDKASKLIIQILRATYSGSVSWRLSSPPASLTRATESFIPLFLEAEYKGKEIVIYEERYKHWTDEDSFNWGVSIRFGFNVGGTVITDIVKWSPLLRKLFEAARDNAADVDSLIDDMLD